MSLNFDALSLTGTLMSGKTTSTAASSRPLAPGARSNSSDSGSSSVSGPELLYATDSRAFSSLVQLLKATADQEHWLLDICLKRTSGIHRAIASEQKKMVSKSISVLGTSSTIGDGVVVSQTLQTCRALQKLVADTAADHNALEAFLRNATYTQLHEEVKHRDAMLKKRVKAASEVLSRLETVEKAFVRALSDLREEERKHKYLLERKALDISEEVEKVEIDLRKCTSQLAIKYGDYEVAKSKLDDMQRVWRDEWHGFRVYTRQLEHDRKAAIRSSLSDLTQARLLIRRAEIDREEAFLADLQSQDPKRDIADILYFSHASLGQLSSDTATLTPPDVIARRMWGNTTIGTSTRSAARSKGPPLDNLQLVSLSRPGRSPATTQSPASREVAPRFRNVPVLAPATRNDSYPTYDIHTSLSASSSSSSASSSVATTPISAEFPIPPPRKSSDASLTSPMSQDRVYGEEMFSVRRKAVPLTLPLYSPSVRHGTIDAKSADTPTKPFNRRGLGHAEGSIDPSAYAGPHSAGYRQLGIGQTDSTMLDAADTRHPSKPLPGLPALHFQSATPPMISSNFDRADVATAEPASGASCEPPPSLPSFSDLKGQLRMSGLW